MLQGGRLFNAAAVVQAGRVLGVVPKTFLPGYKEYYEERWFSSSREAREGEVRLAGQAAPFGTDLLFQLPEDPGVALAVEICEDLWAPDPAELAPRGRGATVILNPSASNDLVAKAEYRRELVRQQSGRTALRLRLRERGRPRVHDRPRLRRPPARRRERRPPRRGRALPPGRRARRDRRRRGAAARGARAADLVRGRGPRGRASTGRSLSPPCPPRSPTGSCGRLDPHPFVPADPATLDERCREVFSIQTAGLARRIEHVGVKRVVLGLSGGLDSTLALLVCVRTFDLLALPRAGILAVTMPGFGTTARTLESARRLAAEAGAELREIDIRPACEQHIRDIGLDPEDRASAHLPEPPGARATQILMDLANKEEGLVVGTRRPLRDRPRLVDLRRRPHRHVRRERQRAQDPRAPARRVGGRAPRDRRRARGAARRPRHAGLARARSPRRDGAIAAEDRGPRRPLRASTTSSSSASCAGGRGPAKILFLAEHAFAGRYDAAVLRRWLGVFLRRFFAQQWKRSVMPDGPKVGSVSLSPRGDWRMPSDAAAGGLAARARGVERGDPGRARPRRRPHRRARGTRPLPRNVERLSAGAEDVQRLADQGRLDVVVVDSRCRARRRSSRRLRQDRRRGRPRSSRLGRRRVRLRPPRRSSRRANAILPLPPATTGTTGSTRLIHVPVRRATRFPVDIADRGGLRNGMSFTGRALNLSVHGLLLLECRQPLEVGEDLRFSLRDAGGHGGGRGDRHRGPRGRRANRFGVELTHVEGDGRVRIKRYVECAVPTGVSLRADRPSRRRYNRPESISAPRSRRTPPGQDRPEATALS